MAETVAEIDAEIAETKTAITAVRKAIVKVATNGQSFRLDTGQTAQTVTQADLGSLRLMLDSLRNDLSMLCVRRDGSSFNSRMF